MATVCGVAYTWPIDRGCLPALPTVPVLPDDPTEQEQAAHDTAQAAYDAALERRNRAEDLAVHVLWALSGRQFGAYEVTVRPGLSGGGFVWSRMSGHWGEVPCGCPPGVCRVSDARVVHLPGPVHPDGDDTPIVVTVAGVALPDGQYTVEGDRLFRVGGVWPRQDLGRPLGDPGTWSVTYHQGVAAPDVVAPLVGALAREFLAACDEPSECRLPSTLTQLSRQGVTHVFDPARILSAGFTGLTEVDRWLAAVNPNRLTAGPVVL